MGRRILEGVRVVDITQIVAGPYCTRMLADLGADVVKIDPPVPDPGTPRRTAGPTGQNVGKRSIVLDLKRPEGLRIARDLLRGADILVENYRPGALAALGLGYDDARSINPRLIYVTISGFGQDTSFASRGAFGATAHAEAGWLWVQQQAQGGEEPFAPGVTVADIATGMNACTAILGALFHRERTGEGQFINVSLMDSQLAFLAEAAAPALAGVSASDWVPFRHGLQRTTDGYLAVNAGSPRNWGRLARAMGRPSESLPADPRAVERSLSEWAAERTTEEAGEALSAVGAPYGVVRTIHDALEHPYFAERGMVVRVPDPIDGSARVIGAPFAFSAVEAGPTAGAPLAGEHTEAVLAELGYDATAVAAMLDGGIAQSVARTVQA